MRAWPRPGTLEAFETRVKASLCLQSSQGMQLLFAFALYFWDVAKVIQVLAKYLECPVNPADINVVQGTYPLRCRFMLTDYPRSSECKKIQLML